MDNEKSIANLNESFKALKAQGIAEPTLAEVIAHAQYGNVDETAEAVLGAVCIFVAGLYIGMKIQDAIDLHRGQELMRAQARPNQ